ncbi:MAG: hypothetical protein H0V55_11465 [Thermoleophilaceae bacterium]|nr:hypothetical protein [Thermoleophilaceae bacterium]
MRFLRHLAREYLLHRFLGPRHRGRGHWGAPPRRRGFLTPVHRQRRRSNVHVSGCCLPIPFGLFMGSIAGLRLLAGRARR